MRGLPFDLGTHPTRVAASKGPDVVLQMSVLCGEGVRLVAFITEPATVRQMLPHAGEPTTAPAIAPAGLSPVHVNSQ